MNIQTSIGVGQRNSVDAEGRARFESARFESAREGRKKRERRTHIARKIVGNTTCRRECMSTGRRKSRCLQSCCFRHPHTTKDATMPVMGRTKVVSKRSALLVDVMHRTPIEEVQEVE
jgi:hypothetical protein